MKRFAFGFKILLLFAIESSGQHRIKLNTGTSLSVEINELSDDSVCFRFTRQKGYNCFARNEVAYIEDLGLDVHLLSQNYKLSNQFKFENLTLEDEIQFNFYLRHNKLNYYMLQTKVLEIAADSVRFLTFIDGKYIEKKISKDRILSIQYSQRSRKYLFPSDSVDLDFEDIVFLQNGGQQRIYVYEVGFQGIKYAKELLPHYSTKLKDDNSIKTMNLAGLEFLHYNQIDKLYLANGRIIFPPKLTKSSKREISRYPRLVLGVEYGVGSIRQGLIQFTQIETFGGEIQEISQISTLPQSSQYSFVAGLQLSDNQRVEMKYSNWDSQEIEFSDNRYSNNPIDFSDFYLTKYGTKMQSIQISYYRELYKGIIGGIGVNSVLFNNDLQIKRARYTGTNFHSGFYNSAEVSNKPQPGIGASLGYELDLGRLNLRAQSSYNVYRANLNQYSNESYQYVYLNDQGERVSTNSGRKVRNEIEQYRLAFISKEISRHILSFEATLLYKF